MWSLRAMLICFSSFCHRCRIFILVAGATDVEYVCVLPGMHIPGCCRSYLGFAVKDHPLYQLSCYGSIRSMWYVLTVLLVHLPMGTVSAFHQIKSVCKSKQYWYYCAWIGVFTVGFCEIHVICVGQNKCAWVFIFTSYWCIIWWNRYFLW